jgi:outer membrane protein assembly factor BamB
MRSRTLVALAVLFIVFGGLAVGGLVTERSSGTSLTMSWVSGTDREIGGNHHAPAVARANEGWLVYAPVSGRSDTTGCALVALDGATGEKRWDDGIPAPDCAIHSVADPTVADYDGDGTAEVLVATTEERLAAHDPATGDVEFTYNLTNYGYTRPLVTDVTGDDRAEIVAVDVSGTVSVIRPDGTTVWERSLDAYTWGQPAVADFDGDGGQEVAVAAGSAGELHLFEHDGDRAWAEPTTFEGSITWMATGQADSDAATEIVVATAAGGRVAMIDGDGRTIWQRDFGSLAAVHNVTDGDRDGDSEVYAVDESGVLTALTATTGETEWTTTLTSADVQMMPPPDVGDVDGDDRPEIVAVTNDGRVSVVDPRWGAVLTTHEREASIFTHPVLADVDGDGAGEVFVMYADGRVARFDVAPG